jgi:hypothetical protein
VPQEALGALGRRVRDDVDENQPGDAILEPWFPEGEKRCEATERTTDDDGSGIEHVDHRREISGECGKLVSVQTAAFPVAAQVVSEAGTAGLRQCRGDRGPDVATFSAGVQQ